MKLKGDEGAGVPCWVLGKLGAARAEVDGGAGFPCSYFCHLGTAKAEFDGGDGFPWLYGCQLGAARVEVARRAEVKAMKYILNECFDCKI